MTHTYFQLNWSWPAEFGRRQKSKRFPTLKKLSQYFDTANLWCLDDLRYDVYEITEKKLENSIKDRS